MEDKEKEEITGQVTRRSLPTISSGESPEDWLPIMSSRLVKDSLVEEKEKEAKEKAEVTW